MSKEAESAIAKIQMEPKIISEPRFVDHIYEGYQAGQRYCFVLGAGASIDSGIRSGTQLLKEWHSHLSFKGSSYIADCAKELALAPEDYEYLFAPNYAPKSEDYFTLFDLRFAGQPNVAYAALEKEMEGKSPSYGYYCLAMLLANTENRLVITTNFDTLVEDSLFFYTGKHPLVVGHESLAPFLSNEARHSMVAKLHRDLLFRPMNRKKEMAELAEEWKGPLRTVLSKYTPIIVGYAGGDRTFMSLLQEIELPSLYWCHRDTQPEERICETVARHNGYLVNIIGFNEIMFQLWTRFQQNYKKQDVCAIMKERTEQRCKLFEESFSKVREKYEPKKKGKEGVALDASIASATEENISGMLRALEQNNDNPHDQELQQLYRNATAAYLKGNYADALDICDLIIQKDPSDASYYDLRSSILHVTKRYQEALADASKAIELVPNNAKYYRSRGVTLHVMKRYEEALADTTKAIELEPDNADYYCNRGVALHEMNRYKDALADYGKAIDLDPNHARYFDNRSITLHAMKRYKEALADDKQAIELEPNNADYYRSRGVTLQAMKRYEEALDDKSKAIELASDNADFYRSRAFTLRAMDRIEEAQQDEEKAETLSANE